MKVLFKKSLIATGVIAILFSASTLYAMSSGNSEEGVARNRQAKIKHLIEELGLTPEQQSQLKEQRTEHRGVAKEIRAELRTKRQELKQELEKQTVDRGRIDSLIGEIKTLIGKQLERRVAMVLSMKDILTPEQFAALQAKRKEHIEKWRDKRRDQRNKYHNGQKGGFGDF